jgi:hypothetical protein
MTPHPIQRLYLAEQLVRLRRADGVAHSPPPGTGIS